MAQIRISISSDHVQETESIVRLLSTHYADPQVVQNADDDGAVHVLLDTELKPPRRQFVADSWTGADGARYTVARDKTSPALTADQKAKLERIELSDLA